MTLSDTLGDKLIHYLFKQINKKKNKEKLENVLNLVSRMVFSNIQLYFYTILNIIILIFCMNCFQFYYYITKKGT